MFTSALAKAAVWMIYKNLGGIITETLQLNEQFMSTSFTCCDYRTIQPRTQLLIYLDPPYEGTTDYGKTFDSKSFWDTVREWSKITVVLVSNMQHLTILNV